MKKRVFFILALIIIVIIAGFFTIKKINKNKRKYEIEEISEFKYFVLKNDDNYGVIDKEGKTVIEATYDNVEIPNPAKDVFICYKNDKGIAMNANNKQLFAEYNSVEAIDLIPATNNFAYEKSVIKTEKNGKYGLIDLNGKQLLNTEYDSIEGMDGIEGELKLQKDEKFGYNSPWGVGRPGWHIECSAMSRNYRYSGPRRNLFNSIKKWTIWSNKKQKEHCK